MKTPKHSGAPAFPRIATLALIVALLMATLMLTGAVLFEPVMGVGLALVFGAAAIGLKKRNAWAGYGLALFLFGTVVCGFLGSVRSGTHVDAALWRSLLPSTAILSAVGLVAFLAGRAISRVTHASTRRAIPWMVLASTPLLLLFFAPMLNPTSSMEPTLLAGDTILIRRTGPSTVKRGDLVAYFESSERHSIWLKRVIGMGGDRIRFDNKILFINGVRQGEPYVQHVLPDDAYRDNFPNGTPTASDLVFKITPVEIENGEFVVPRGSFFVLGDNRDNSMDSRYRGAVDASAIVGKAVIVYSSRMLGSEPGTQDKAFSEVRWDRFLKPL